MTSAQRPIADALRLEVTAVGPPAQVAQAAHLAEQHGLDRLYTAETAYDPFQALAVAASRTSSIELATGVAVAFARTPMTLAASAWTLQQASGGRAVIGLGSQVSAHVTRRFSMPWSNPAARLQEFVAAVRAIWDCWQNGSELAFQGNFYTHTLMTPTFCPAPSQHGVPKILIAAVGPLMTRVAGATGDGLLCHPFSSASYLEECILPIALEARTKAENNRAPWLETPFEVAGSVLTATGRTEREFVASVAAVRERIAFYASTPAYRPVLDHHGWGELQEDLYTLSLRGQWKEMGRLIDDEMLHTFAVVAESPAAAGRLVRERCSGLLHSVSVSTCTGTGISQSLDVLAGARHY
uniref:TIGR03617 family F420-dependent LLM class oxidoreductase n=1 Tax=Streptomyces sp. CA-141956 TaxID=3240051 RepID=UPI003F493727